MEEEIAAPIKALVVEPGKEPYVQEIGSDLKSLQNAVGGYIEMVSPFEEPVAIICNEEGKNMGLPLNRSLRYEDGDIADIIAGTFLIVGAGDEDFISLPDEYIQQFAQIFKNPEEFYRIQGHIVAVPVIREEPHKHDTKQQQEVELNMDTSGLAVAGHIGTWHTINHIDVDGHTFWLMEHDTYGDDAAGIILDENGRLSLSSVYNGFDEHTVDLLRQEVMPIDRMPDPSISIEDMKDYGYGWGGMLPMREEVAAEVMKSCAIYRLYEDDTEGMVEGDADFNDHVEQGGIFGIEKVDWKAELERQNSLAGKIQNAQQRADGPPANEKEPER